jgi:hypothetical protein
MNYDIQSEMRRAVDILLQEHMSKEDARAKEMQEDIKQLREDMAAFTAAWNQAKGVITFVKWAASIAGGFGAFFLFIKDHLR